VPTRRGGRGYRVFPRSRCRRRRCRRRRRLRSGPFSQQQNNLLSTTPARREIFISRCEGPRGGEPVVRKFFKNFVSKISPPPRRLWEGGIREKIRAGARK